MNQVIYDSMRSAGVIFTPARFHRGANGMAFGVVLCPAPLEALQTPYAPLTGFVDESFLMAESDKVPRGGEETADFTGSK